MVASKHIWHPCPIGRALGRAVLPLPQMAPSLQWCGQTALAVPTTFSCRWALGSHGDLPQVSKPRSGWACETVLREPQGVVRVPPSTSCGTWQCNLTLTAREFMRVKVNWGNVNHSGQDTKPFLWIVKALHGLKSAVFDSTLLPNTRRQYTHSLGHTRSHKLQSTPGSRVAPCLPRQARCLCFTDYNSKDRRPADCRQQHPQHPRPDLGFIFSRHSSCLWQFSVGSQRQKLFPKGSVDQAGILVLGFILKMTFIACWSKRDNFFLWKI